ncbi:hypothetical protein AAMO2058_000694200 [Amorphochlora amoebiformis]
MQSLLSLVFLGLVAPSLAENVTIWCDNSVDFLNCIADTCPDQLGACYGDVDGCREIMKCAKACPFNDAVCQMAKCISTVAGMQKPKPGLLFLNLTTCAISSCPRDEDEVQRQAEAEAAQDKACIAELLPIDNQMNHTVIRTMEKAECMRKLYEANRLVGAARDTCKEELDVVWMRVRNNLNYSSRVTTKGCRGLYHALHKRVRDVIRAKISAEDDIIDYHESQGETAGCENVEFGEAGAPWRDADGDTCAVYVHYVCRNGTAPLRILRGGCEHHDCKGTGGLYADSACCACGGGVRDGKAPPIDAADVFDHSRLVFEQSCMLGQCIESLGACQAHDGCLRGLNCVSKNRCKIGTPLEACRDQCADEKDIVSARAREALLDVIKCAGSKNRECVANAEFPNPGGGDDSDGGDKSKDSGTSGNTSGSRGKDGSNTAAIVVGTLLGAALVGGGAFGLWQWHKRRQQWSFRRVQINDGEDSILDQHDEPEL